MELRINGGRVNGIDSVGSATVSCTRIQLTELLSFAEPP